MKNYGRLWKGSKGLWIPLIIVLTAPVVLLLTSCRATRILSSDTGYFRTDSVVVVETVRDTIVEIRADSSLVRALLECDSLGQVRVRELVEYRAGARLGPPAVQIKDNILTASARVDSMAIYLHLKDRYRETVTASDTVKTITVEVNRLNGWQKFWVRTGQVLTAVLATFLLLKLTLFRRG